MGTLALSTKRGHTLSRAQPSVAEALINPSQWSSSNHAPAIWAGPRVLPHSSSGCIILAMGLLMGAPGWWLALTRSFACGSLRHLTLENRWKSCLRPEQINGLSPFCWWSTRLLPSCALGGRVEGARTRPGPLPGWVTVSSLLLNLKAFCPCAALQQGEILGK
jgi:hypothetical protein